MCRFVALSYLSKLFLALFTDHRDAVLNRHRRLDPIRGDGVVRLQGKVHQNSEDLVGFLARLIVYRTTVVVPAYGLMKQDSGFLKG